MFFWHTLVVLISLPFFTNALNSRATTCNGHAELCDRTFGNVTYVGAHDSYAVGVGNIAANQDYDITQQLNDGIRMLQMQAHNSSGEIRLCHTSCGLYDGGSLQDYLTTVKKWMDANPNDVVSLLIVNIDNLPVSQYASVFVAAGVDKLSYSPQSPTLPASGWPTLGALIDAGTRLITFIDNGADTAAVPYIIDEFTNIWETAYNVIDKSLFNCKVDRSKGDTSTTMILINHFLDTTLLGQPIPDIKAANVTNSASGPGSLGEEVATCVPLHNRNPTFMLVDFYEYGGGSVFQVAATANGVQYSGSVPSPATASGAKPSSTGGSGSSDSAAASHSLSLVFSFAGIALGAISVFI